MAPKVGITAREFAPDVSDAPARLDEIERLGVDTTELPVYAMDVIVGGRVHEPHAKRLRQACAGRQLGYSVHGPLSINFFDPPFRCERHLEVLKASLEITASVGARNHVLHTGFCRRGSGEALEDCFRRQREWLAKAGDLARPLGVVICVENLFDWEWGPLETATASRLASELAAIGHASLAATIDFSHAQLDAGLRGGDVVAEVKALAPHARHTHLHDSFGLSDDIYMYTDSERLAYGHGDLHLPIGWGTTPWDGFLAECTFASDVLFNVELSGRHWYAAAECVEKARAMASRARLANAPAT